MPSIRQNDRKMIIQGEAQFNGHTWFLGIGPIAFPLLIVLGGITGLVTGKLYLADYLKILAPEQELQMAISLVVGVIVFVVGFAMLASLIRSAKRSITIDNDTRTVTWYDVFNKNWRFQRSFDEIDRILVYKTTENILLSSGAYKHGKRTKDWRMAVPVIYANIMVGERPHPLMSGRNRKQVQLVAEKVAAFLNKPLEDTSDVMK